MGVSIARERGRRGLISDGGEREGGERGCSDPFKVTWFV